MGHRTGLAQLPPGARVVIRCPSGPRLAELLLTCFDARLVAVPLDPRSTDRSMTELADRVDAALIVDGRAEPWRVRHRSPGADGTASGAAAGPTVGLSRSAEPDGSAEPVEADGSDGTDGLAFIMFTSGSTGRPKGVTLDRRAVLGNAGKVAELHGFGPDRPHGSCLPLFHVNALMMSLLGTRLRGTTPVLVPRFDPAGYFDRLRDAGARTASIVPALLHRLLEVTPPWPESLDYLVTAAAPLTSELAHRFHRAYGPRLRQGYGLSEAVNFSFTMPLLDRADFLDQYVHHHPPVGLPLPETELRLVDGEVWVRTPDLMRGYWRDPAATASTVTTDGWLRTGDLGELRDGFLVLRGRRAEVINRGGEKFHPLDVERSWRESGLPDGFAVPVAHEVLGTDVGLVLPDGPGAPARLRRFFATAGLKPVAVQVGAVLTTSTGKPQRGAMGARLAVRGESADRYAALLSYAIGVAGALTALPVEPVTGSARRIRAAAEALLAAAGPMVGAGPRVGAGPPALADCAAVQALDALLAHWPRLADGTMDGPALMRTRPGLWKRLMTEWPMGSYARLMADVLTAQDALTGPVLEVGTGVGNTTGLLVSRLDGDFTWSDGEPALVARGRWPGRGVVFDFDQPPPPELSGYQTIFATNAVHCAADKPWTLAWLRSMLTGGGRLYLAEGANPTTGEGFPWALDFLFCAFAGWWDRGGFLTRWDWLGLLDEAGFAEVGFSQLRAGRYDLGGVYWATRPPS